MALGIIILVLRKQSLSVVKLNTNLGKEAVRHGLVETGVEIVITSSELFTRARMMTSAPSPPSLLTTSTAWLATATTLRSSR